MAGKKSKPKDEMMPGGKHMMPGGKMMMDKAMPKGMPKMMKKGK